MPNVQWATTTKVEPESARYFRNALAPVGFDMDVSRRRALHVGVPESLPTRWTRYRAPRGSQVKVYPAEKLTPELAAAIKEHKADIRIMREDEEMRRTGIIQSERQVFEVAREHFGLDEKGGAA